MGIKKVGHNFLQSIFTRAQSYVWVEAVAQVSAVAA